MRDRVTSQPLDDETLREFGFDVEDRVLVEEELSPHTVRLSLKEFARRERRFDVSHWEALSQFMQRQRPQLFPSVAHLMRAFALLWNLGIIRAKPPKPEQSQPIQQPRTSGTHGVNLRIEPDSAIERRKQWERYTTQIVATDPRTGRGWTQYQLDHEADSETYRRLVFGDHAIPRVTDVITEG